MRKLLSTLLLLAAPFAAVAGAQCPINGITTTDVGTGTGFLAPSALNLGFDSTQPGIARAAADYTALCKDPLMIAI